MELFQRTIDPERVRKEIVNGYLNVRNKLKFFNSLTIVLLPKDEQGHILNEFKDYENQDPPIPATANTTFDEFFKGEAHERAVFGGVQYVKTHTASLARLRWDMKRVEAVAVDGQHRLKALKLWMQQKNDALSDTEKPTRVPVIFLLLNDRAGFKGASSGMGIRTIAREIFTDLNKNAKEVDLATQIVLDDRSVESCCVRSLITDSTCSDVPGKLPLSLLRWQEANNRFDQRYYLNSLVNLHLLVKDLIALQAPKDPMSRSDAQSFIRSAETSLGSGSPKKLIVGEASLTSYYDTNFIDPDTGEPSAPFSAIPHQYLEVAVKGFQQNFAPWLIRVLTEFEPYKQVLTYARQQNLIAGEFSQFQSQPKSHQAVLENDMAQAHGGDGWRAYVIDKHVQEIERIKGMANDSLGDQWAFKTIFQKALVRLAKVVFFDSAEDERDRLGRVEQFVEFFDRLHSHNILRVRAPLADEPYFLWTFISVNPGNEKIQAAKTSEDRIQALLSLWYFGWRYASQEGKSISGDSNADNTISPSQLLRVFSAKSSQSSWPQAHDHYDSLLSHLESQAHYIKGVPAAELKPDVRKKLGQHRLAAIYSAGLQPWFAVTSAQKS